MGSIVTKPSNHMVAPLTSVLEESLLKLELLKLVCHNDEASLLQILGGDKQRADNQSLESMQTMNALMEDYLATLSDPDLEFTAHTIASLDGIKSTLNIHFHQIYTESMKKISKTSLNVQEIIGLNQEQESKNDLNIKNIKENWEKVCNSFLEYLTLSTNSFTELSEQYNTTKTAETAQDCIDRLLSEYEHQKQDFDAFEIVLKRERDHRASVRADMSFNINKLQNDFDCISQKYDEVEKGLNDLTINTTKQQTETHEQNITLLNSQIEKAMAELVKVKESNCELELEIKKKVKRLEMEIDEIKNKYNMDMISISVESNKLVKLNASETNRLSELQVKIDKLNAIREEHEKLLKEQRAKEEELKQICEKAATKIQKIWRGHSVRKANKKKKKDKKKDKKKKN